MEAIKRYVAAIAFFTLSISCILIVKFWEWDKPLIVLFISLAMGGYNLLCGVLRKD